MIRTSAERIPAAWPGRQKGLSTLMLILVIALVLLIASGSTIAGLYAAGLLPGAKADPDAAAAPQKQTPPALYLPLEPAIVVNYSGEGRGGYLQADVELMTRDKAVIEAVRTHMPVVRNNLILMFGEQSKKTLTSRAGKESLRQDALEVVNDVLANRDVDGQVEAMYFTSFILQ